MNKICKLISDWKDRPRVSASLIGKRVVLKVGNQVAIVNKDGFSAQVEGCKLVTKTLYFGNAPQTLSFELKNEKQATAFKRRIYKKVQPAHNRLFRALLLLAAFWILLTAMTAEQPVQYTAPSFETAPAPQTKAEPAPGVLPQSAPEQELALPPAPFMD